MSRGPLEETRLKEIEEALPDFGALLGRVRSWNPAWLSMAFPYDSDIPVASVCFNDCLTTVSAARYAMHEDDANRIYHRKVRQPPSEPATVFFERYYLDDVALRLYSAGEHLTKGLILALGVSNENLSRYRKSGVSLQAKVGAFLKAEMPTSPLGAPFLHLNASEEWQALVAYRNRWVHEQPPSVDGLGIQYRRERQWERTSDKGPWTLDIGGGDTPEYTTEEIARIFRVALQQFVDALDEVAKAYNDVLADHGITYTEGESPDDN